MDRCKPKMYFRMDNVLANNVNKEELKNIVRISYSILNQNKQFVNSVPTCCKGCGASLSLYSQLLTKDEYYKKMDEEISKEQVSDAQKAQQEKYFKDLSLEELGWICEFCGIHNRLLKNIPRPESEDELYLIKKAPETAMKIEVEEKKSNNTDDGVDREDDTGLIFCIDVSGSMGDRHPVNKNGKTQMVSRLELVVGAVLKQIVEMKKTHPNRKVGVVSFEDIVRLYGDRDQPIAVNKMDNNNFDQLLNFSREQAEALLKKPLHESAATISQAIKSLKPLSSTALGPGLLCSLGLLQGKRGSRIILCTDGLANVGLGSLGGNGQTSGPSIEFYDRLGNLAVEFGLSISIITIEGNACRVDALGPLTDRTGGTIHRVNPTNMDLSEIAANKLIATNVSLKVIIHEGLAFENQGGSVREEKVGSVTDSNQVYFEYYVKDLQELQKVGIDIKKLKAIPIQSQITYTDLKGNEYVRVLTQQQELTQDEKEAKKGMKGNVLAGYVQTESANLVLKGKAADAKAKNKGWTNYMQDAMEEEADEENLQVWNEFQVQNQELNDLIEEESVQAHSNNVAKKDDVATKLYKIKQTKKK